MNAAEQSSLSLSARVPVSSLVGDFAGAAQGRVRITKGRAGVASGARAATARSDHALDAGVSVADLCLLAPGAARRLRCRAGTRLTVVAGRIWLTESGVYLDRFVGPGQSVPIGDRGRVVVECISPQAALLDVQPAARARPWRPFAGRIDGASSRIISGLRRLARVLAESLAPMHRAAEPGLGALSAWQLKDIGAPQRVIQAARERELAERRWRDTVLGDRQGNW